MNTARSGISNAGAGTVSAALAFGGASAVTEDWNGANWVEVADLNTARENHGGVGTTTAAIAFGGSSPTAVIASTEEWNGNSIANKVLTD